LFRGVGDARVVPRGVEAELVFGFAAVGVHVETRSMKTIWPPVIPSWLPPYVNAFQSPDPTAERIVISFNAAV